MRASLTQSHEFSPAAVLDFWFPNTGHENDPMTHRAFWTERMQGGMDEAICRDFGPLTEAAARGELDHWAEIPRGRLALIIALDQFPRSYWRDRPRAYAQDIRATCHALTGIANGHWDALDNNWEKQFYLICISHCEGPDHLARIDLVIEKSKELTKRGPPLLRKMSEIAVEQGELVRANIAMFGRHPHRNKVLDRPSTKAEDAYVSAGIFPHNREIPDKPSQ
jgi:uncharacterized protein (DUF924 family)